MLVDVHVVGGSDPGFDSIKNWIHFDMAHLVQA